MRFQISISSDDATFLELLCTTVAETFCVRYDAEGSPDKKQFLETLIAETVQERFVDMLRRRAADSVRLPGE